jgi:peptidase M23-like protein
MRHMRPFGSFLKHYAPLLLSVAGIAVIIGIIGYIASNAGVQRQSTQIISDSVVVTSRPPPETPIAPFAQVDPAIIPYLEHGQPQYGIVPLEVLGPNLPPVGAYLPRSGNTQFELPTSVPTPIPSPTIVIATRPPPATLTPHPTPALPTPTSELVATVLAFAAQITSAAFPVGGAECAPSGLPVDGSFLSQRFTGYHSGIDLVVPPGTPVSATQSGVVVWADWNVFGYGNLVIVQSGRFITYYAHNTSFNVLKGDVIGKGGIVSFSGNTGHSSGPHVHYETRIDDVPVDPLTFEERGFGSC